MRVAIRDQLGMRSSQKMTRRADDLIRSYLEQSFVRLAMM
jgi:hypothetical protein